MPHAQARTDLKYYLLEMEESFFLRKEKEEENRGGKKREKFVHLGITIIPDN